MRRRGFTLIELLVLVTIIAVVFALLAPAVQRSRQEAQKTQCKNNLKQIALALHNYHDVFVTLPPGWVSREGHAGAGPRFGWMVMILPFIEQAPLYNRLDFNAPLPETPNRLVQQPIALYLCPSDTTPDPNPLRGNYGTSNYSGNYGDDPFPRWLPLGQSDFWPGSSDAPMKSSGLFARNSRVRFQDITDGLSNTLMTGERSFTSGAGIWPGVTDNAHENDALSDTSHRSPPNGGLSSFSSRHGKTVNIGLGDGSVRSIAQTIDSQPAPKRGTWQLLGHKSDGEAIGEF